MSKFNKDWLSYACFELYIVQIGSNLPSKWKLIQSKMKPGQNPAQNFVFPEENSPW